MKKVDLVILGGGGAGLMCGIEASKRGLSTIILDHAAILGRKILISGGGRCNFTNIYTDSESYVSKNPHFVKSALSKFTPADFISLVEKHKIAYHEKKLGQLFCDNSAQNIVDMLKAECDKSGAQIKLNSQIEYVGLLKQHKFQNEFCKFNENFKNAQLNEFKNSLLTSEGNVEGFITKTQRGTFLSKSLVVATGGLSVPKVGATGIGYEIAKAFGHNIVETMPALDGFVFSKKDKSKYEKMYGTACDVNFTVNGMTFRENILFTHLGLSGPASLQGSLYWKKGDGILLDMCPEIDIKQKILDLKKSGTKKSVKSIVSEWLPNKLAKRLISLMKTDGKIAELSYEQLEELEKFIKQHKIQPIDTVGFVKAEVTKGGVDTYELSSKTMESNLTSGLFFIGEVVDVTGQLGGYNFQWAWSSGYVCGQSV